MVRVLMLILALVFALVTVGCKSGVIPAQPYVTADRLTKTAVDPILQKEVKDHPEDAQRVSDLDASWESRLSTAEAGTTAPTTAP